MFAKNNWERKNLRKKIEKKREIGACFRTKGNKTCKHKLQKRRRSKRRHLIQSTIDSTKSYIDDGKTRDLLIEDGESLSVVNKQSRSYMISIDINTAKERAIRHVSIYQNCIICNESYPLSNLLGIECKMCQNYLFRKADNGLNYRSFKHIICQQCASDIDVCTTYQASFVCSLLSPRIACNGSHTHTFKCASEIVIQRSNELFEPNAYEFAFGAYAYSVDRETIPYRDMYKRYIDLNGKYFVAYCKNCTNGTRQSTTTLVKCAVDGCSNLDTENICANHQCYICAKFATKSGAGDRILIKICSDCNQTYCESIYWCESPNCGSKQHNLCKYCYADRERNPLMKAIHDHTPLCNDVCRILYEYARGFMFECNKCEKNVICVDSLMQLEKRKCSNFYCYFVSDAVAIQRHKQHLTKVNDGSGNYMRIFCKECSPSLTLCGICDNRDAGIFSMRKLLAFDWYESPSICYNHRTDAVRYDSVNQCSLCSEKGNFDCFGYTLGNYRDLYGYERMANRKIARKWLREVIECKVCNKRFCKKCQENGTLGEYIYSQRNQSHICLDQSTETLSNCQCEMCLKRNISKEWLDELKKCKACNKRLCKSCNESRSHYVSCEQFVREQSQKGVFNEYLMDSDCMMNANGISKKLKKKYNKTRRERRDKNQCKSYWNRKNDKRGNRKYNQRSSRRNLVLFMLKNEI